MSLYLAIELSEQIKKELTVKQLILKQKFEAEYEDPTRFHITVRFLSDDESDSKLVMDGLKLFKETYQPKKVEVKAKDFGKFPQGVLWAGVHDTLPLYDIKYQIEDCLRKVGYQLQSEKHKGYTPHITMAYGASEVNDEDLKSIFGNEISVTVDNISLWAGFKANEVYIHNKLYDVKLI